MRSEAQRAYYDRIRGVSKGPDSLKTRAAKSASHRAEKGTRAWQLFYAFALRNLRDELRLSKQLGESR